MSTESGRPRADIKARLRWTAKLEITFLLVFLLALSGLLHLLLRVLCCGQ